MHPRCMRAESACVRRNKRSFCDQQCAKRGRTLRVIRGCDVSMNALVIRAAARERGEDDAVERRDVADFRELEEGASGRYRV